MITIMVSLHKKFMINNIIFEYIDLNIDRQEYNSHIITTLKTRTNISNMDIIRNWQHNTFDIELDNYQLIGIRLTDYDYSDHYDRVNLYVNFKVDQIYQITNPDLYYKQKLRKDKLIEI